MKTSFKYAVVTAATITVLTSASLVYAANSPAKSKIVEAN